MLAAYGSEPICWRCQQPILGQIDAGHILDAINGGTYDLDNLAPEHQSCNRSAGGKLGAARRRDRRSRTVMAPLGVLFPD